MTDALTAAHEKATAVVAAIADPIERYQAARDAREKISEANGALQRIQRDVVLELRPGRTWAEVGDLIGVTGSRAEAIAKER